MVFSRLPLIAATAAALLGIVSAGCGKKATASPPADAAAATAPIVATTGRSPHFEVVSRQLELGGPVFFYADVAGDLEKVAQSVTEFMGFLAERNPELALAKQDYAKLLAELGLDNLLAVGFSSTRRADLFSNRFYLHAPGAQGRGLWKAVAAAPHGFDDTLRLAPVDADGFWDADCDFSALLDLARLLAARYGQQAALERALAQPVEGLSATTVGELLGNLKGRVTGVARLDSRHRLKIAPGHPFEMAAPDLLLRWENQGWLVERLPSAGPRVGGEGLTWLPIPVALPGEFSVVQPILASDGKHLYLATSLAFLEDCLRRASGGLTDSATAMQLLKELGSRGNAFTYATPQFFSELRRAADSTLSGKRENPEMKMLQRYLGELPQPSTPIASLSRRGPDGFLVHSLWPSSHKSTMVASLYPVTVGLLSAMAIPAFQKVRQNSEQSAILNNLRQLHAASEQYFLEHDKTVCTYRDLVGPGKPIAELRPVAGEDYRGLLFKAGATVIRVRTKGGRTIEFHP